MNPTVANIPSAFEIKMENGSPRSLPAQTFLMLPESVMHLSTRYVTASAHVFSAKFGL
jgi:hypothetical protein